MDARDVIAERLATEHRAALREIADKNSDLAERVRAAGVRVLYDQEEDVLAMTVGKTEDAVTETIDNSLAIRVDPETSKIVGLELFGFRSRSAEHPSQVRLFVDMLQAAGPKLSFKALGSPEAASESLARDIRDLVLA